ncbi:MAG: hypothetical protein KGL91_06075 [Xanthomonadaceae bacterium]|nr:hypothetical protein [Xanthomonadaceae bacterium]
MSWDGYQRTVLEALGHVVYAPLHGPAEIAVTATGPAAPVDMLARLAKAAGVQVAVLQHFPDVLEAARQLHGNAAAKRALWARLRTLRRNAR